MEYEINSETLALLPISKNITKVIEVNNNYIIKKSMIEVLETSCNYFGSSFKGRLEGSKSMLGSIYKPPIIIEESSNIIFFPTMSPFLKNNIWVSLNNILKYESKKNKTIIYFKNNKRIEVNVPYLTISNQIMRSNLLGTISKNRKILKSVQ